MSLKREVTITPLFGEISDRMAPSVFGNNELRYGLREAVNVLVSRNMEVAIRPPTHDVGATPNATTDQVARSFQFRMPDGNFTILTFTALKLTQTVVGSETTFTAITTTWTDADILVMDAAQNEEIMIFVTAAKEPMTLIYTTSFAWATLESVKTSTNATPWYTDTDWPVSISFMIGRFIAVSPRKYYGSAIVAGEQTGLEWDISTKTVDGETLVMAGSAFGFNAADDLDSGFTYIKGGSLAFGLSPSGVWMMSNYTDGLNATNPNIKNYNTEGSYPVKPEDINGTMVYFASDGTTLKTFGVTPEGPINFEINKYSKHIFEYSKPVKMVYQRIPDTILWILRDDDTVIAFTRDETRQAWSHVETLGNVKDIWLGKDNTQEYLYLDVERARDRRIERIQTIDPLDAPYHGDDIVMLSEAAARTPTSETDDGTGGGKYTIVGHGWSGTELVRLIGVSEYTYGNIVYVDVNTIQIVLPNANYLAYGTGTDFDIRDAVESVTIAHYASQDVDVLADGYLTSLTANDSGVITLNTPASEILVCLPYYAYIQPQSFMNIHLFHKASVSKIFPRVYMSNVLLYGKADTPPESLTSVHLDSDGFTGYVPNLPIQSGVDYECSYRIGGKGLPFILVSCFAEIEVGEN